MLSGCASLTEHRIGVVDSALLPCGTAPRCVSSTDPRPDFYVAPLTTNGDAEATLQAAKEILDAQDRTSVIQQQPDYLRAEIVSPWGWYTDDLELMIDADRRHIHVRSTARLGYYDFGVNRDRVEALRSRLKGDNTPP